MARQESDREDLLREATALVQRVELRVVDQPESMVVGFRRDGSASFYFTPDFVVQTNRAGELRRVYFAGRLLKAVDGTLAALQRQRQDDAVILLRTDLTPEEQTQLLEQVTKAILQLKHDLGDHAPARYEVVGEVPVDGNVLARVRSLLEELKLPLPVAARPNVAG